MEGPVSRNITGTWGKNVLKKPTGSRGGRNFFLKKKVSIKICNISHLLSCKLPRKFISWVSEKTKMSNCIVFFAVLIIVEIAIEALPLLVIYLFN